MSVDIIKLFEVSLCKLYNKSLAEKLLPVCDYFTEKTNTTLLGTYNYPSTLQNETLSKEVNNHPAVKETFEFIFSNMEQISKIVKLEEIFPDVSPYGFFSKMENGNYLRKHRHTNCNLSGCFYLDVSPNVPGIYFFDPNPFSGEVKHFRAGHEIIQGTMLIWPKWLEHEVLQKLNDTSRKVFTFNL